MGRTIAELERAVSMFQAEVAGFYQILGQTAMETATGLAIIEAIVKKKILGEKHGKMVTSIWEDPAMANSVVPARDATGKTIPNSYETIMDDPEVDQARNLWTLYNAFTLVLTHAVTSYERRASMHQQIVNRLQREVK